MKPELLAPAGDLDSLVAAINNGADAVYLGIGSFNARATAPNFTTDNISEAVQLAHLHNVKVYVALNTLVSNAEIPALLDTVTAAVNAKADAFIVQDLGVASILSRCFEGICLHASTQMGIHNLYGAQIAQRMGIQRVVLSRETKLTDIAQIRQHTNLQIEFFVQGALCVGFSGQCYMSATENGKSGNRGRCLQLCRLPYTAQHNTDLSASGYLLSTADLCLIDNLKLLADNGVTAFKIEGRLRRAAYVAEAVDCYRKAIDKGFPAANPDSANRLKKVFFRGEYITKAYLDSGVPSGIINTKDNNHIGIPIGEVVKATPFKDIYEIEISTKHPLTTGDGLKFFDGGNQIGSIGVGNAVPTPNKTYKVYGKVNPKTGAKVNIILDKSSEDAALARTKKLPITIQITAEAGSPLLLSAAYGDVTVTQQSDYILPLATSQPTSASELASLVSRVGDSVFFVQGTTAQVQNVFIPKSITNQTRRNLLQSLSDQIIARNSQHIKVYTNASQILQVKTLAANYLADTAPALPVYESNSSGSGLLVQDGISVIYPDSYTVQQINLLTNQAIQSGYTPCLRLPAIANGSDIAVLNSLLAECKGIKKLFVNNLYGFAYASQGYEIIAGWGINIFNNFALDTAISLGASKAVQSIELQQNLAQNGSLYKLIGKGLPIMTLSHCPFKTVYNNNCTTCKYSEGLRYKRGGKSYSISRHKVSQCYFDLIAD